jgi:hypothetical protein
MRWLMELVRVGDVDIGIETLRHSRYWDFEVLQIFGLTTSARGETSPWLLIFRFQLDQALLKKVDF